MSREQLTAARDLIKQKRYGEARALLRTVDHPIATEWLMKLDEIAPEVVEAPPKSKLPLYALVGVLIVALVGAGIFVASRALTSSVNNAVAVQTASSMARYFPADTQYYVSLRIDDEIIAQFDEAFARLMNQMSGAAFGIPFNLRPQTPITLADSLDMLAQPYGGDFEATFRLWLGNDAAVGATPYAYTENSTRTEMIVVSIKDKAKAVEYVGKNLPIMTQGAWGRAEEGDFTLFTQSGGGIIAIGSDVLYFAEDRASIPLTGLPSPSLADSAEFQEMLARLPESNYGLLAYVNLPQLVAQLTTVTAEMPEFKMLEAIGPLALGVTILDGRSLVVDYVQRLDQGVLQSLGISFEGTGAIDPAFLAYVPADATYVMHATNLAGLYDSMIGFFKGIASQMGQDTAMIEQSLAQMEMMVGLMSGINLREDLLSWMTGDYVGFVTYTPPPPGQLPYTVASIFPNETFSLNMEYGYLIEVTDAAKARNLFDKLENAMSMLGGAGAAITHEQIGGVDAIVISVSQPGLAAPLETIIAVNDRVFVMGTRKAVTTALSGAGGFEQVETYHRARDLMLDNATMMFYADSNLVNLYGDALLVTVPAMNAAFANIITGLNEGTPVPTPDDTQIRAQMTDMQSQVRLFASMFESATISAASNAEGDAMIRLVITMAE